MLTRSQKQGTSLAVQWLRLCASTAEGTGSIPGQGTKIPHATEHSQKKKDDDDEVAASNNIKCLSK